METGNPESGSGERKIGTGKEYKKWEIFDRFTVKLGKNEWLESQIFGVLRSNWVCFTIRSTQNAELISATD